MQTGKFNCVIDCFWGSSGKGKLSAWLADKFNVTNISSSNFTNAGHSFQFDDGQKFVAKAIPTALALKKAKGMKMTGFISPGSGFSWGRLIKEWGEFGRPNLYIHARASIVTEEHAKRESEGAESTKHIASTMQGSATAMVDKILRKKNCILAGTDTLKWLRHEYHTNPEARDVFEAFEKDHQNGFESVLEEIRILEGMDFRAVVRGLIDGGHTWLHEGSQGYALSIDHGSHYPMCTSRNCNVQAALDQMAIQPQLLGDVYLNLRTYPIRVGNVVDAQGIQQGYSGDFYRDCKELTWEEVAKKAGMPAEEAINLAERERTTVTKRIRRVCTFSFDGLKDAVRTNGATKLCLNFVQYINWKDAGLRGEREAFRSLSHESREFIERIEEAAGIPVELIGTGAGHSEMISLL